jgi:hypothetical protein
VPPTMPCQSDEPARVRKSRVDVAAFCKPFAQRTSSRAETWRETCCRSGHAGQLKREAARARETTAAVRPHPDPPPLRTWRASSRRYLLSPAAGG